MIKRKSQSIKKNFNPILKIIRSSKENKRLITKRIISDIPDQDILKFSSQISENPTVKKILLKNVRTFSDFYNETFLFLQVDRTLKWCEAIILNNIEQIEEYLILENKISMLILSEDYDTALKLIDKFIQKYGESFSLLQVKTHLLLKIEDKEAADLYLSSQSKSTKSTICSFLIRFQSQRLNSSSTYVDGTDELNSKFEEAFGSDNALLSIIKYKILPFEYCLDVNLNSVLVYELNSSLIDLYKAYCFTASVSINKDKEIKNLFLKSTTFICSKINDASLKSISFSLGNLLLDQGLFNKDIIHYVDSYTKGDYLRTCNKYLDNDALHSSFNAFELYLKSLPRMGEYEGKMIGTHVHYDVV